MVEILKLDTPNKNGHIYPTPVVLEALAARQKEGGPVLGLLGFSDTGGLDTKKVAFKVTNFEVKDGQLHGTVKFLNTPLGRVAQDLVAGNSEFKNDYAYSVAGTGVVDKFGVISDFKIISVSLLPKEQKA
jgi:hypothetical protein